MSARKLVVDREELSDRCDTDIPRDIGLVKGKKYLHFSDTGEIVAYSDKNKPNPTVVIDLRRLSGGDTTIPGELREYDITSGYSPAYLAEQIRCLKEMKEARLKIVAPTNSDNKAKILPYMATDGLHSFF